MTASEQGARLSLVVLIAGFRLAAGTVAIAANNGHRHRNMPGVGADEWHGC